MKRKRTYLVTGVTGFVGSYLFRRLIESGQKVHILIRKQTNLWRIKDIVNKATVHISDLSSANELEKIIKRIKPNIIYHLATHGAYSFQDNPEKIINTNMLGTFNLLRATSGLDYELFVNTGSSSEYGFKKLPMKEGDLLEPASYYAVSKCSQTLLCCYIARKEKKPVVTLRLFSVYGPYEEPTRFIPTLLKSLYLRQKINLVSSEISRDYIYVDDVIEAYLSIEQLKKNLGEIFNIGTGRQYTIKEVVETAVSVTGKTTDFGWGKMERRIWDTDNWVADISKAKALLDWSARINLEEGLSLTWEWFKKHQHLYVGE